MEHVVTAAEAGQRLDLLLRDLYQEFSRARIQQAIRDGCCLLDGNIIKDPACRPKVGQTLAIEIREQQTSLIPGEGDLDVVWEDAEIAICFKPAGLTVHPCPSCAEDTLAHLLLARFPGLAEQGGERPGIVHRLDRDTSGLIIVALTDAARLRLTEMFAERRIRKEYFTLVAGVPPEHGESREPIGRHPELKTRMAVVNEQHGGRSAHTEWLRLWHNGQFSLLRVVLHSGRTHQIRVHLAHLGFPLLGDAVYAPRAIARMAPRQMLHAGRLAFTHPFTGEELDFKLPPPADFLDSAVKNCERLQKVIVTGNQGCGKSTFTKALGLPVTSADQIVANLYGPNGDAAYWIRQHIGEDALDNAGAVNKQALFRIMQVQPDLKREFERVIHGLVEAEIEKFWDANSDHKFAVAEIPLYFESGIASHRPGDALVVGVSCPREKRWRRIAANRGWDLAKIETIESWQWPEAKKMAACDEVIDNSGSEEDLLKAAADFAGRLEKHAEHKRAALLKQFSELCGASGDLRRA